MLTDNNTCIRLNSLKKRTYLGNRDGSLICYLGLFLTQMPQCFHSSQQTFMQLPAATDIQRQEMSKTPSTDNLLWANTDHS